MADHEDDRGAGAVPDAPRPGEAPGPRAADQAPPPHREHDEGGEVSGTSGQSGSAGSSIGGAGP